MTKTINILCLNCGEPAYLTPEQAETTSACPNCGDTGTPADLDETVTVTITAHELRILTFWSDTYAALAPRLGWDPQGRGKRIMKVILDRLGMQTEIPLSMSQELADLRKHFKEDHGEDIAILLMDDTGACMECGEPIESMAHSCYESTPFPQIDLTELPPWEITDEHRPETDDDTPPYSS